MDIKNLSKIQCQTIEPYLPEYEEHKIIVCDTETIEGKPYTIQFYDGDKPSLYYVNETNILDVQLDYIEKRYERNLSVWYFFCQFDLPIIHYPFKDFFTMDNHEMLYGDHTFKYVTGKTWYGNHTYGKYKWFERDAFQYVFRGLDKIAKDLNFPLRKLERPDFLGQRAWRNSREQKIFEEYAIQDVLVLWHLVYWILDIHRKFNVGLSVSLADLAGKIFRKHFVKTSIVPTTQPVTLAALSSYHGGKTQSYVKGPAIVKDIHEYDITSAYPYAMTQIANFNDYEVYPYQKKIHRDGLYKINAKINCSYQPIFTEKFKRDALLQNTWITGYELLSSKPCIDFEILDGYVIESNRDVHNGISKYVWTFFELKAQAKIAGNKSEELIAKLDLNALYGKFISRVSEEVDIGESWRGGVLFHPLIATCITGFVRAYVHDIEHTCSSLHTSTDSFITRHETLDTLYQGMNGLGGLKKEYKGDCLIIRPKVYVIFDKLDVNCYHKFAVDEYEKVFCVYCHSKVLKAATHGFYGSVQLLLNMWKGGQTNYKVNRMMRLKEAKRMRDPDVLPFVFSKRRRSLNVEWSNLTEWRE